MSLLTKATVISVSSRRSVVNVYVDGKGYELKSASDLLTTVNQLTVAMQNTRNQLDRSLLRLTSLELDNCVTLGDITSVFYLFEVLQSAGSELDSCIAQLGREGKIAQMQREEYLAGTDEAYTLMIRDYAADSSEETARAIRKRLHDTVNTQLRSAKFVAKLLGYSFIDTDLVIQHECGMLLKDIIADKGVDGFIETENSVCSGIRADKSVIATGGSVIYGSDAMRHLKNIASVVYLEQDFKVISERLKDIKNRGVVLREGQTLSDLYKERSPLYLSYADVVCRLSDDGIEANTATVIECLKSKGIIA